MGLLIEGVGFTSKTNVIESVDPKLYNRLESVYEVIGFVKHLKNISKIMRRMGSAFNSDSIAVGLNIFRREPIF